MTAGLFALATQSVPFSNGTERDAWMSVWCSYCVHDHAMHGTGRATDDMCEIIGLSMMGEEHWRWPEAWTPEPPGSFRLLSRLICGAFTPCTVGGCTGDPAPTQRAERAAAVHLEWSRAEVTS